MRLRFSRYLPLLGVLAVAACKDDAPPQPANVLPVSDIALSGVVDETLGPLTVKVTDNSGAPVGGAIVTFAAVDGGGSVSPAVDTTDNTGVATTRWRLGTRTVAQRATASVTGVTTVISFVATARAATPSVMTVQAGDNQSAAVGTAVTTPPSVLLRDRFQNPVSGITVVFATLSGGGSIAGSGATSDANGVATAGAWTLGPAVGANRLTATALSSGITGNPLTFTATGTAGSAAAVVATTATTLSGTVGGLVTPVPTVRVTDANGNAVVGATVTFAASTGSTVIGSSKTTGATGTASPDGWQLGALVQNYTLTATVAGAPAVTFTASAAAGAPAAAVIVAGNNQSAGVGRTLPIDPAVRVTDALNNPIAGIPVLFEVTSGGGSAVARSTTTDATGTARVGAWTLGDTPGTNTLRATVTGAAIAGNPLIFTATALPGAASSLAIQTGNNQSATAGALLPVPPTVIVRDSRGNAVSGVTVTFTPGANSGTVTTTSTVTNSAGVASAGGWRLGNSAGAQTLTASVDGVPAVVFTATAGAGVAARAIAVSDTVLGSFPVTNFVSPVPSVRVVDESGNPVSGAVVNFDLDAVGAMTVAPVLTGVSRTTGSDGVATLGSLRLGSTATTYRVRVTVSNLDQRGLEPTFFAIGTAGRATQVISNSVANQTNVLVNTAVASSPSVRVVDEYGNGVANVAVIFTRQNGTSVLPDGGSANTRFTNASGIATLAPWIMGATAGAYDIVASVAGTGINPNSTTFSATAVVPPPAGAVRR